MSTEQQWIKMSERRPNRDDFPVYVSNGKIVDKFDCGNPCPISWTHWMPAEKTPAPPKRDPTQAELDKARATELWDAFWLRTREKPGNTSDYGLDCVLEEREAIWAEWWRITRTGWPAQNIAEFTSWLRARCGKGGA